MLISVLVRKFLRVGRRCVNFKFSTCMEQWAVGSIVIWTLQDLFTKLLTTLVAYKRNQLD